MSVRIFSIHNVSYFNMLAHRIVNSLHLLAFFKGFLIAVQCAGRKILQAKTCMRCTSFTSVFIELAAYINDTSDVNIFFCSTCKHLSGITTLEAFCNTDMRAFLYLRSVAVISVIIYCVH